MKHWIPRLNITKHTMELSEMEAENATLRSSIERHESDTKRLNAILDNLWQVGFNNRIQMWTVQENMQVVGNISEDRDFRKAIDDAIDRQGNGR